MRSGRRSGGNLKPELREYARMFAISILQQHPPNLQMTIAVKSS